MYYANTPKNTAKGKSGVVTDLPMIVGFAPNNNINPDNDADGYYAFMVFPNTDYYVVATASGYQTYTSGTLSVGVTILKHDIAMVKNAGSGGGEV